MSELFIYGDPRFLSGGKNDRSKINYESPLPTIEKNDPIITTEDFLVAGETDLVSAMTNKTSQAIHTGKHSYHYGQTSYSNIFVHEDDKEPTVGVELEMEERTNVSRDSVAKHLHSNWFHFERDSSLCIQGREGYELVTEALPSFRARDINLWVGLQNILVPWFESYSHAVTGLHVHVGLQNLMKCTNTPFHDEREVKSLARALVTLIYYSLYPRGFVDRVMLRSATNYCASELPTQYAQSITQLSGSLPAYKWINAAVRSIFLSNGHESSCEFYTVDDVALPRSQLPQSRRDYCTTGHHTELNFGSKYTVEFRRGKGTLHAPSILRMVELAVLTVKYAEFIMNNPEAIIGRTEFKQFVIENTKSEAFRTLAEKYM